MVAIFGNLTYSKQFVMVFLPPLTPPSSLHLPSHPFLQPKTVAGFAKWSYTNNYKYLEIPI